MVPDAAVFRSGDSSQFQSAIVHLEGLDQFGTVIEQAMLKVDRRKRRRQLPHISGGGANQAAELAVAPMGRCDRLALTWNEKLKPLRIVARCLDADRSEVKDFVKFYLTGGQKLVSEVGYVKLPPDAYDLALKRFENLKTGSVFAGAGSKVGVTVAELLKAE